jgi:hypothetical protein
VEAAQFGFSSFDGFNSETSADEGVLELIRYCKLTWYSQTRTSFIIATVDLSPFLQAFMMDCDQLYALAFKMTE